MRPTDDSWRVDETYILVKGKQKYLYRAVDSAGNTLDFLLTAKRDALAAKRFFRKTLRAIHTQTPRVITVDKNPAYPKAIMGTQSRQKASRNREITTDKISQQYTGTRPSRHQTISQTGDGIWLV